VISGESSANPPATTAAPASIQIREFRNVLLNRAQSCSAAILEKNGNVAVAKAEDTIPIVTDETLFAYPRVATLPGPRLAAKAWSTRALLFITSPLATNGAYWRRTDLNSGVRPRQTGRTLHAERLRKRQTRAASSA